MYLAPVCITCCMILRKRLYSSEYGELGGCGLCGGLSATIEGVILEARSNGLGYERLEVPLIEEEV